MERRDGLKKDIGEKGNKASSGDVRRGWGRMGWARAVKRPAWVLMIALGHFTFIFKRLGSK